MAKSRITAINFHELFLFLLLQLHGSYLRLASFSAFTSLASSQLSHYFLGYFWFINSLTVHLLAIWLIGFTIALTRGSLRSVTNELLDQPRSFTKTYGESAVNVCASGLWNNLPLVLCKANSTNGSKRGLKTYLFEHFVNSYSLFLKIL